MDDNEESLEEIRKKLTEISDQLVHRGPRPKDPHKAERWNKPIQWHLLDLRETLHAIQNTNQVFIGFIEQFKRKLEQNAELSRNNSRDIAELATISKNIETRATQIEEIITVIAHEKPLLMRDLYWLDTNPIEILLVLYAAGEAMIFLNGSDKLTTSAMFNAMSVISSNHAFWGFCCGALALGSAISFLSRRRNMRIASAFANFCYFGVTGCLSLALSWGTLGWLPHILACLSAAWVLSRGPARAT